MNWRKTLESAPMTECLECGAPAEVVEDCGWRDGVDFDGAEAMFHMVKVLCAAGRYHQIEDADVIKL